MLCLIRPGCRVLDLWTLNLMSFLTFPDNPSIFLGCLLLVQLLQETRKNLSFLISCSSFLFSWYLFFPRVCSRHKLKQLLLCCLYAVLQRQNELFGLIAL